VIVAVGTQVEMQAKYPLVQVRGGIRGVVTSTPGFGWQGYLVPCPDGKPINPRQYPDTFKALSRKAKISVIPLKNARHTSVTLLSNAGVQDHLVAAWHGPDETVMRAVNTDAQAEPLRAVSEAFSRRSEQ
jgi:hypothetical protein